MPKNNPKLPFLSPIHADQFIQKCPPEAHLPPDIVSFRLACPAVGIIRLLFFVCFGKPIARTPKKRGFAYGGLPSPPASFRHPQTLVALLPDYLITRLPYYPITLLPGYLIA